MLVLGLGIIYVSLLFWIWLPLVYITLWVGLFLHLGYGRLAFTLAYVVATFRVRLGYVSSGCGEDCGNVWLVLG